MWGHHHRHGEYRHQQHLNALQQAGFEVLLVPGSQTKNVKGRKTDVLDCQWIQKLHSLGLLSGSLLLSDTFQQLRTYYYHRQHLMEQSARYSSKMQKALRLMNIRLDVVLNDITGQSGMAIIEAMLSGTRDPECLASLVSWALSETMEAKETTIAAFQMAVRNRPVRQDLLFHSDRGVQYACQEFRDELKDKPVLQSMSRKGNCWDNAVAESFFKTMKTEMVYHCKFATRQQARLAVFEYIEGFYNRKRRHSALGYLAPCQYENQLYNQTVAA
ncbi:IS3 family transposase [Pontibacter beigongshangensis]|uniref:IS3 family transposase n=1 Tax=Pontibacter beigongshangensis TaxID=2574733 RepID=UPI0021CE1470|nr:IS3 family transposase [Pontibacter beigongshangensis]